MNPLISILIPAYKALYLKEAITSCLKQTYSKFEIIIVDDASPEDLQSIVCCFNDSRLKYFRNKKNCGATNVVDNWNICLGYSSGDYVMCIGDDDKLLPWCLDEYVELINKFPDLGLYHAWTELIDEQSNYYDIQAPRPEYENLYSLLWNRWNSRDKQYIGDFLFEANILKKNGGFYKLPMAWASDDISAVISASYKGVANTPKICFQYRVSSYTISNSGNNDIKLEATIQERNWYDNFLNNRLPKNDIESKYYQVIMREKGGYFEKKIGFYLGLAIKDSITNIIKYWRLRKKFNLSSFVFKYAILIVVKKTLK